MRLQLPALALCAAACLCVPASAATISVGFVIEPYATVTDPIALTFAPDGTLYTGRDARGSGGDSGAPVSIIKTPPGGGLGAGFGRALLDPDSVAFDIAGAISGVAGSVLVGGTGGLFAVRPDGTVATIINAATLRSDIDGMRFDSMGRLVMLGGPSSAVTAFGSSGLVPILTTLESSPTGLAIGSADDIYISIGERIARYDSLGNPLNEFFATGLGSSVRLAFAQSGPFAGQLFASNFEGEVYSIAADGSTTLFGSGFASLAGTGVGPYVEFGPDGALYVGEFANDRVLRISPAQVPAPSTLALMFAAAFIVRGRAYIMASLHRSPRLLGELAQQCS